MVPVSDSDLCVATKKAVPYYECDCGNRHVFADPHREGRLLEGWGTLVPTPTGWTWAP